MINPQARQRLLVWRTWAAAAVIVITVLFAVHPSVGDGYLFGWIIGTVTSGVVQKILEPVGDAEVS